MFHWHNTTAFSQHIQLPVLTRRHLGCQESSVFLEPACCHFHTVAHPARMRYLRRTFFECIFLNYEGGTKLNITHKEWSVAHCWPCEKQQVMFQLSIRSSSDTNLHRNHGKKEKFSPKRDHRGKTAVPCCCPVFCNHLILSLIMFKILVLRIIES